MPGTGLEPVTRGFQSSSKGYGVEVSALLLKNSPSFPPITVDSFHKGLIACNILPLQDVMNFLGPGLLFIEIELSPAFVYN